MMVTRNLDYDKIDVNNLHVVEHIKDTLKDLIDKSKCNGLSVRKNIYFKLDDPITTKPGWYIMFDKYGILYDGVANDLNSRLNSYNNTTDNFANPNASHNAIRNFIKKYCDMGIFNELKVLTITEETFCKKMQIEFPLSKKDRENIESNIKLFKYGLWRNIRGTL